MQMSFDGRLGLLVLSRSIQTPITVSLLSQYFFLNTILTFGSLYPSLFISQLRMFHF